MKKALVFYLYGTRNAGDMAICVGAIELLRAQGYDITMVSRFSEAEDEYQISKNYITEYYPDVKISPGLSLIHILNCYIITVPLALMIEVLVSK